MTGIYELWRGRTAPLESIEESDALKIAGRRIFNKAHLV